MERFSWAGGHDTLGIERLFVRFGHDRAMQVIQSLVRDDARGHAHDVALGDGLGFAVSVERSTKQRNRGRGGRSGESEKYPPFFKAGNKPDSPHLCPPSRERE
jgi:hypothetical protein